MGFFKDAQYWLNSASIHTEEKRSATSVRAKLGQQSPLPEAEGEGKKGSIHSCKEPAQDIGSPQHQIFTSQLLVTEENTIIFIFFIPLACLAPPHLPCMWAQPCCWCQTQLHTVQILPVTASVTCCSRLCKLYSYSNLIWATYVQILPLQGLELLLPHIFHSLWCTGESLHWEKPFPCSLISPVLFLCLYLIPPLRKPLNNEEQIVQHSSSVFSCLERDSRGKYMC